MLNPPPSRPPRPRRTTLSLSATCASRCLHAWAHAVSSRQPPPCPWLGVAVPRVHVLASLSTVPTSTQRRLHTFLARARIRPWAAGSCYLWPARSSLSPPRKPPLSPADSTYSRFAVDACLRGIRLHRWLSPLSRSHTIWSAAVRSRASRLRRTTCDEATAADGSTKERQRRRLR